MPFSDISFPLSVEGINGIFISIIKCKAADTLLRCKCNVRFDDREICGRPNVINAFFLIVCEVGNVVYYKIKYTLDFNNVIRIFIVFAFNISSISPLDHFVDNQRYALQIPVRVCYNIVQDDPRL